MIVEFWYMVAYVVGTATGWWLNRQREQMIVHRSVDILTKALIDKGCVNYKISDDGELEILTLEEAEAEWDIKK
jgi:hypothetical protein